jgi:uncharacterized protein affecting Mg2+/Co2+ transport
MTHTYLFEEGTWLAHGHFTDGRGESVAVRGESVIRHDPDRWLNRGFMEVLSTPPFTLRNAYEIMPWNRQTQYTSWTSHNPALGDMVGYFVVVGDSILSEFRTLDGTHHGTEYLRQMSAARYINRGVLMKEGRLTSSWAVELNLAASDPSETASERGR